MLRHWLGAERWPAQVINNTVIDCVYGPQETDPAVTVYAGTWNPNATTPVNTNVVVKGNLVLRGGVRSTA